MHDLKKKKKKKVEVELPIERRIHNLVAFMLAFIFSPVRALVYTRGSQKKKNIVRFTSCR